VQLCLNIVGISNYITWWITGCTEWVDCVQQQW